jgi:TPR repeat protein
MSISDDIAADMDGAARNDTKALCRLAFRYTTGDGVPIDLDIAKYYYDRAANLGDADAQVSLALLLHSDQAGVADIQRALALYERAAAEGHPDALFNLGVTYEMGDRVPIDQNKAIRYYELAAESGHQGARFNLANYLRQRVDPNDQSKAVSYYSHAAKAGHIGAAFNLAWMYHHGVGVPVDADTALEWYRLAASGGDSEAALCAAELLLGDGDEPTSANHEEGVRWLEKAAEAGNAEAQFNLGLVVDQSGKHVHEAMVWYSRAAESGHVDALIALAEIYRDGAGSVEPDMALAREFLTTAADRGSGEAAYELGELCSRGGLGTSAVDQAQHWYRKAAELGYSDDAEGKPRGR